MSTRISNGTMTTMEIHNQLTTVQTPAPNEVRELIARRAYELYENRADSLGDEISDWLQAEDEIVTMLLSLPVEVARPDASDDRALPRSFARTRAIKTTRKKAIDGSKSNVVKQR